MKGRHEDSFRAFVEAQLPRLHGLARVLTASEHDAWDLTQECLLRVGLHWARVEGMGDPGAYARQTLVRLNIDRLRRIRRETLTWRTPDKPYLDDHPGVAQTWLIPALALLSPQQRTALALRFIEDQDTTEIARTMNCRVGTVRGHVSRGLARLRQYHQVHGGNLTGEPIQQGRETA